MAKRNSETRDRLVAFLREDEIYRAYFHSAAELEERFEIIAASLPPEERRVLIGYCDSLKLMQLRALTIAAEEMEFH